MDLSRTEMLLGGEAVEKLSRAHVAVFGIGGVGGHALEALVRSGVGEVTVVDGDSVAESNLNRQIIATRSTVGMRKVEAARARIAEINPDCTVHCVDSFVLPENITDFDFASFDYVLDAVDTVSAKLAIAEACDAASTPLIASMGAGNKLDPTRFEVSDIYKTSVCPLAAAVRREARRRGLRGFKVVYSREEAAFPAVPADESRKRVPASCAFVPSVCGLIMAGEAIRDIAKK